ncbi:MAG: hypothetical protein AAFR61_13745 [Bacteroidota bacterium]
MDTLDDPCFNCEGTQGPTTEILYGHAICDACKGTLGLYQDATIEKHRAAYAEKQQLDPAAPSFQDELYRRLEKLEKDFILRKIKFMHMLDRLEKMHG